MKQLPALYLPTNAEMLALRRDTEQALTFEQHLLVRATGLGGWGGVNMVDAVSRVRGELGAPHLSFLPELVDRGFHATALGRTLACLEGLTADVTASGWRITEGFAKEGNLAQTVLASDINALADVVGKEKNPEGGLKVRLLGPFSLAASTYLTNGELVLIDYGARRDLCDSLLAGLESLVERLKQAAPGLQLSLQFDEPLLPAVLAGAIKTSSGYSTVRALRRHEAVETLAKIHRRAEGLGVNVLVRSNVLELHPEIQAVLMAPVLNLSGRPTRDWEQVARMVEAGARPLLETVSPRTRLPVGEIARGFWVRWRDVGLAKNLLSSITLTDLPGLEEQSPEVATTVLGHLTETARALSEIAQDA